MMPPVEDDVLAANAAFYAAFASRDLDAMERVWAEVAPVACIHPGWHVLDGRAAVMASWRGILRGPGAPEITCASATARVLGETAFVVCTEDLPGGQLAATNVFVRENAAWKLVHHHAGPVADDDDEERPPASGMH